MFFIKYKFPEDIQQIRIIQLDSNRIDINYSFPFKILPLKLKLHEDELNLTINKNWS